MTSFRSRLLAAALAAALALGGPASALADEFSPVSDASADLLEITVGDYTPDSKAGAVENIQKGGLYTLIVLPASKELSADLLAADDPDSRPLYVGSAVASGDGQVTFTGIRLRTSEASVYYVTGPGLDVPLREATSKSVSLLGSVTYAFGKVANATVSLVDETTRYAYSNTTQTTSDGSFLLDRISPGRYFLHVEKPGFLPATSAKAFHIKDGETHLDSNMDLSAYLGDVNGDGVRDMSDLTALLSCYGKDMADVPAGLVPDLSEDGRITALDAALLISTMQTHDSYPAGVGVPQNASLSARDVTPAGKADRTLRFALDSGGISGLTFTAASFSLTLRTDYIQPINQNGGVVSPNTGGGPVSCLVPAPGVTVSDARWAIDGDLATLSFSLSCSRPTPLTQLVDFLYRPAPGKTTEQFFEGVFSMDHAAALVGQGTVLPNCALEYPSSSPLTLDSISVRLSASTVTIPSAGHESVFALSAVGHRGETEYPDLSGVTWALDGDDVTGVSIVNGLLTVSSRAQPGQITVTATVGEHTSSCTVTLQPAEAKPHSILIARTDPGEPAESLSGDAGVPLTFSYAAEVIDQYGAPMAGQTVAWSLSGAPAQLSVSGGVLSVDGDLPAGTYTFSLLAGLEGLRSSVNITLTLESRLDRLVLSGPSVSHIPSDTRSASLLYLLSALDASGCVIPTPSVTPEFTVASAGDDPTDTTGLTPDVSMNGEFILTVSPEAQPGDYILRVALDDVSASLTLTLQPPQEATSVPVRAAFTHRSNVVTSKRLTLFAGDSAGVHGRFIPILLDAEGRRLDPSDPTWSWAVDGLADGCGLTVSQHTDYVALETAAAPAGSYFFTLTATHAASSLSVSIPVEVVVLPKVARMSLNAPESLSIPSSGSLSYSLGLTCADEAGSVIAPPGPVLWSVVDAGGKTAPAGVSVADGVLSVSSSAKPETVTLHAVCYAPEDYPSGSVKLAEASCQITLAPSATEKVFALLRDGELFTGGVDAIYGKEGADLSLEYTPVLRDPTTGEVEELTGSGVTWQGLPGAFTVDAKSEPGVYTAPITALYEGQAVSLTAQITVYPDIVDLYLAFDEGDDDPADDGYSFAVSPTLIKTYRGDVMAVINRNGKKQSLPLAQLGLKDYSIDFYIFLNGVYLACDKATGRVTLTVEPLASGNSMEEPSNPAQDNRILFLDFSYYPDDDLMELEHPLFLTTEDSAIHSVLLRRGTGSGNTFTFETAGSSASITTSAGTVSDCFAMELLDQYGAPLADQTDKKITVDWELTGSPLDGQGRPLITVVDPGTAVRDSYPRYKDMRRLRVAPDAPAGEYRLTLTATAKSENVSVLRGIDLVLSVLPQQPLASLSVTGPDQEVIPRWYEIGNKSTLHEGTKSLFYIAVAKNARGEELDPSLLGLTWKVLSHEGGSVSGVSVSANKSSVGSTTATATVDRYAQPTEKGAPVAVTVTAAPKNGGDALTASAGLTLIRDYSVPFLLTVIGTSSHEMALDAKAPITAEYTFKLVDQYNIPVSDYDAKQVKWSISSQPSYVQFTRDTDNRGYPSAKVRISNPGRDLRTTFTLTASTSFTSSKGVQNIGASLKVQLTVGNPPDGGGSLGGDGLLEETVTTATVTPSTSKSGTAGSVTLGKTDIETLTKTTATGTLTIAPKNTAGLSSISVSFPFSLAKALASKSNSLRIQTAIGTLTLPTAALRFSSSLTGDLVVTILNQEDKLSVSFRTSGGSSISSLPSNAKLQAAVKGDLIESVEGTDQALLQKAAIQSGTLTADVAGTAVFHISTQPKGKVFSDTANHWAKNAIAFVTERDLFQGTSETTFSPNGDMTRSMVVTVLHRMEKTPAPGASNPFADVPNNKWFTDAVVWANAKGIVKGTGSGFLPNDSVTREQLAAILYRYMTFKGYSVTQRNDLSAFSDRGSVSSWAKAPMEWAVAAGLITGKGGGVLDPGGKATRAEVATLLQRLLVNVIPSA